MYSLRDAAEAVGLGKPSILKAIQKGRISAKKNELGQWEIDPAELHRVYKAIDREPLPSVAVQREEPHEETRETPENNPLKAKIEALQEQLNREREWGRELSRRLDEEATDRRQSAEEVRRLTLLLTYRPEPPTAPAPEIEAPPAILPAVLPSQQEAPEAPAPVRSRWEAASLTFAAVFAALVVSLAVAHWIGWI